MDVDAASSKFRLAPSFVSSVSATTSHQALAGAGTIYSPTRRGFHMYLGAAPGVKQSSSYWEDFLASVGGTDAANSAWHVNYLGYEGDSCPVTRWRSWSKCTQGDDGVYRQRRQRNTMQARKCFIPMLIEQRHCTPRKPTPAPSPPPTPSPTPKQTLAPTLAPTPDFSVFHAAVTMTATLLGQSLLPSTSDGVTHAAGAGSKVLKDATRRAHFCEAVAMAFGVSRDRVSIHTVRAVDARGKAAAGVQLGSLVTFRVLARTQYVLASFTLTHSAPLLSLSSAIPSGRLPRDFAPHCRFYPAFGFTDLATLPNFCRQICCGFAGRQIATCFFSSPACC